MDDKDIVWDETPQIDDKDIIWDDAPKDTSTSVGSKLESAAAGAVQGITRGAGDEISGLYEVGQQQGNRPNPMVDDYTDIGVGAGEAYSKGRDTARAYNNAQEAANPGYYLGGNIGGSILSPAKSFGGMVGEAALQGLGSSEGNLTSVDKAKELAMDTGISAGGGALVGGAFKGAGKVINALTDPVANRVSALKPTKA